MVAAEPRSHEAGPLIMPFRISYADLTQHGFTVDRLQCDFNLEHLNSTAGLRHTNACRERLPNVLMATPAGRRRLEACEE